MAQNYCSTYMAELSSSAGKEDRTWLKKSGKSSRGIGGGFSWRLVVPNEDPPSHSLSRKNQAHRLVSNSSCSCSSFGEKAEKVRPEHAESKKSKATPRSKWNTHSRSTRTRSFTTRKEGRKTETEKGEGIFSFSFSFFSGCNLR